MQYISKAALDQTLGVNFMRQDLSPAISLTSTRPRPISQYAPRVPAKNTTHQWIEQGRNGVAGSGGAPVASYQDGNVPNTAAKAPTRPQNTTANVGLTAQVTDVMAAAWSQGGSFTIETGQEVKLLTEAMDEQVELAVLDCLDFIEYLHVSGDSTNSQSFAGGQPDGLIKWITASGIVVATGGTTSVPVAVTEQMIKDGARSSAEQYPSFTADTMLVPPELVYDINSYVGNGAGRPIFAVAGNGPDGVANLVAGAHVGYYDTGYGVVKIELEPDLSPLFNPNLSQCAIVLYNKMQGVKHASLIPFGSTPLAKTDTSVKTMVNNVFTQEHRVAGHAIILPNIKSAFT